VIASLLPEAVTQLRQAVETELVWKAKILYIPWLSDASSLENPRLHLQRIDMQIRCVHVARPDDEMLGLTAVKAAAAMLGFVPSPLQGFVFGRFETIAGSC
jgi:hypothetical protein